MGNCEGDDRVEDSWAEHIGLRTNYDIISEQEADIQDGECSRYNTTDGARHKTHFSPFEINHYPTSDLARPCLLFRRVSFRLQGTLRPCLQRAL